LAPILSLGNQYVSNFVETEDDAPRIPLDLVLCDAQQGGCGLLQLRHTTEASILYRNYWYQSGINQTMRTALADITAKAERLRPLKEGDITIDIGSNDGTLLRSYLTSGIRKMGFEPAANLVPSQREADTTIINDFFAARPFRDQFGEAKASIITSIAMFYDLEDPNAFVADVVASLDPEGLWIIQMSYLPLMLTQNAFDNICHEHLEYYSLHSLNVLLKRHGLRVIDVELNDVNGGSFRAYVVHDSASSVHPFPGAPERIASLEASERDMRLDSLATYAAFAERVERIKRDLVSFIRQETQRGKTVYVYGASTKGNTLLQYFGLDHALIRAAAERNPQKWGKKTVGTYIPIVSEEAARKERPDYFLVLPWHFIPEFVEREHAYLASGGAFIVPLPEFRIIDAEAAKNISPIKRTA